MGSASSKAARTVASTSSTARRYPTRTPTLDGPGSNTASLRSGNVSAQQVGPAVHTPPRASGARDQAIDLDASDPDFAASLRSLGAVKTNQPVMAANQQPSVFPDPSSSPALRILDAQDRIAVAANHEASQAGKHGYGGRQLLDVITIRQMLMLRDEKGVSSADIERRLGLRRGVVSRLGPPGLVSDPS